MPFIRLLAFPSLSAVLLLLAACGSVPPPVIAPPQALPLAQRFAMQAGEGGRLERLDAAASALRIHVFRAGRAARLGHNHVLAVPRLEGMSWRPDEGMAGACFELQFRLDEMLLDAPELRAALGLGWASVLSAQAVAATRANMLGDGSLQAEAFPWVRIRSLQIVGEAPKLAARVEIELHGQRREQWLPLHAEIGADGVKVRGALVLRQSDFGITPFSVGAGLLAVSDELVVEFELQTQPSK